MTPIDYFQSYENYFWNWEEDAEVISINNGATIAYTEEIIKYLEAIAENGLPTFGSILLSIIAINEYEEDPISKLHEKLNIIQSKAALSTTFIQSAFDFLKNLQSLPKEYKIGQRRTILLKTIFTDAHNRINSSTSRGIVQYLKDKKGRVKIQRQIPFITKVLIKDINVLEYLFRKFPDVQSILDAIVDLSDLSEDEILDLESNQISEDSPKDLIEQLINDPKSRQIGLLIKPIWAGFSIPIFSAHPSDQPLGGVSDLTTKGDFDKLLISEFANDDLTFMSRLANNEALFFHREMPPIMDTKKRIILIDVSLKSWGTPKILAHATSLAIANHPKSKIKLNAFLVSEEYSSMDYDEIGNIIDGIQKVGISLNASKGIESFLEANKRDKNLEIFLITTEEGSKDPQMKNIVSENKNLFKYLILTNAEGEIKFFRNQNNATKHLQTIKLPLSSLWKKQIKVITTELNKKTIDFNSLPIFLPIPNNIIKKIPTRNNDIYFVANRSLLRLVDLDLKSSKGCELVFENVPPHGKFEIGNLLNGDLLFISFFPNNKEVSITNLTTLQNAKITLPKWKPKAQNFDEFLFQDEKFIFYFNDTIGFSFQADFKSEKIEVKQIEINLEDFSKIYEARQKEYLKRTFYHFSVNIIKNLKHVFINRNNFLSFNNHQLEFRPYIQHLGFTIGTDSENSELARAKFDKSKKAFVFKDNSEIKVEPNGYFLLKSSNVEIPIIYITSTIDSQPGFATNSSFSGFEIYHKIAYYSFTLKSTKSNNLTRCAV